MTNEQKLRAASSILEFRLPAYQQIPDVGLYLEQTSKYIARYLDPLQPGCLTNSMISNYVKKGLIDRPVKKQYSREQIAYLFFIALAKNVLSLDALSNFIALQKKTYDLETAYRYFSTQLEELLLFSFEQKDSVRVEAEDAGDEKRLLYSCIAAISQKIYLEKSLEAISENE